MMATDAAARKKLERVRRRRLKVRRERAKRSLEYTVSELKPEFDIQWFHSRICEEITSWAEVITPYVLILEVPPGYGKSTYAKLACAWCAGRDPDSRVIYTSYTQDLADEHCGDVQSAMFQEEYKALFPETRLNERRSVTDTESRGARRTKDRHDIIGHDGGFRAVGVGGSITGFRADWIVIDDPLKGPKAASSPTVREDQWRFYNRTLKTRKRPGRPLRFLLLLTRWHLDDIAGRIQAREKDVKVVKFEALKDKYDDPADPRDKGEALWPAVDTKEELEQKKETDAAGFAALYQTEPVPEGGAIIKAKWLKNRWEALPAKKGTWIWTCDPKAGSKDPDSSRAVIQLWFQPQETPGRIYLVDQRKGVWDQPETLEQLRNLDDLPLWKRADAKIVENKADGKAIIATLEKEIPGLIPVEPQGDKQVRARATTPYWHAGNIWIPDEKIRPWVPEFVDELTMFPGASHDDQVDAMSLAVWWFFIGDEQEGDGSWMDKLVNG